MVHYGKCGVIPQPDGGYQSVSGYPTAGGEKEKAATGAVGGKREYLSEGESGGGEPLETVTALFIFGGVQASGFVHSDCFIIVPP